MYLSDIRYAYLYDMFAYCPDVYTYLNEIRAYSPAISCYDWGTFGIFPFKKKRLQVLYMHVGDSSKKIVRFTGIIQHVHYVRPVIFHDISWFQDFLRIWFALKFSWKKRNSHQEKKRSSLYCVQTSSLLFVGMWRVCKSKIKHPGGSGGFVL